MAAKPETKTPPKPKSPAEWAYDRLVLYIRDFERQLNADQEVAIGFAGSEAGIIRIEGLGFFDPDILTFYGTDDAGMKMQLVQHVSQLSVMLQARPRRRPPPHRLQADRRVERRRIWRWLGLRQTFQFG
jgi:hypothetical protein